MVSAQRIGKYTIANKTKTHTLISDVATTSNGYDAGMNPHEILEAALASCTAITLQMYADRKQIPLTSADIEVNIDDEAGAEVIISRKIVLNGDLTEEQKSQLITIADKCPIHKLLSKPIKITNK